MISGLMLVGYAWIGFQVYHPAHHDEFSFCFFKNLTGIPCPSCGITRSIVLFCQGNVAEAILLNPLGLIAALALLIAPFWILFDSMTGSQSVATAYKKMERFIQQQKVYVPLIALLILNWYWNIEKGL